MTQRKPCNRPQELQRINEQFALLDTWATMILTNEVGYDPALIGDVATKLVSDYALVVLLRNGLRDRRRQLLKWDDEELELVDIPNDPLLIGWVHRDEASLERLDALAKAQGCTVPELLVQRLRQAADKHRLPLPGNDGRSAEELQSVVWVTQHTVR